MSYLRSPSGLWLPPTFVPGMYAGNAIQVDSATGGIKVKSNGIVVAGSGDPCCCSSCPCPGGQPSVSVVFSGCFLTSGTGGFISYNDNLPLDCQWRWAYPTGVGEWGLDVFYQPSGNWSAGIFQAGTYWFGGAVGVEIISSLSCVGGTLTGGFSLSGTSSCAGFSATVSL